MSPSLQCHHSSTLHWWPDLLQVTSPANVNNNFKTHCIHLRNYLLLAACHIHDRRTRIPSSHVELELLEVEALACSHFSSHLDGGLVTIVLIVDCDGLVLGALVEHFRGADHVWATDAASRAHIENVGAGLLPEWCSVIEKTDTAA